MVSSTVRHKENLAKLEKEKKKTTHKSIFLIGPLGEKAASGLKSITLIAGLVCVEPWGGEGGLVLLCGVVFEEVLDSAQGAWISGGKPSHVQEQLITTVCSRMINEQVGLHVDDTDSSVAPGQADMFLWATDGRRQEGPNKRQPRTQTSCELSEEVSAVSSGCSGK